MKRMLALLLCLVMCLSLVPAACAEDLEVIDIVEVGEEEPIGEEDMIAIVETETTTGDEKLASKPVITTQPKSKTAYVDTTVKFTVKATGATSYQWKYRKNSSSNWNNSTLKGATTATLSVKAVESKNGYQYRCAVTNSAGTTYSDAATLTVSKKPVISTQPLSYTASVGTTVKFTVAAAGASGYQWQYRTSENGSWKNSSLPTAITATLAVKATEGRNGLQYRCKVKNAEGTTYSKTVTLTASTQQCGDNLHWVLDSKGVLTISGTGPMYYIYSAPWGSSPKKVVLNSGVTSIGNCAFYGCSSLTSVTIPDSVISIEGWAFSGCSALTGVTIPDSVKSIGPFAFSDCSAMTSITAASGSQYYSSKNGVLFNKVKTVLVCFPCGKSGTYTIPNGVKSIGVGAFSCCKLLTSVTIPDSVTQIGERAFEDCSGLTSVTIPAGVTDIDNLAFLGCSSLKSITVASGNKNYSSKNGVLFDKDKTRLICFPGGKSGAYTIPGSVTRIECDAFEDCRGLSSVTIPSSVTEIGIRAFSGCSSLTSVTIPSSVTEIYDWTFAFCSGLTSVTIPKSVKSIDKGAFYECSNLKDVYYTSTKTQWSRISISVIDNDPLWNATKHYNA